MNKIKYLEHRLGQTLNLLSLLVVNKTRLYLVKLRKKQDYDIVVMYILKRVNAYSKKI